MDIATPEQQNMANNIDVLKNFLSKDFSIDSRLFIGNPANHRGRSEGRKINKHKLGKFITGDDQIQSDSEQERTNLDFKPIKEENEELKYKPSTPNLKSSVNVSL